MNSKLLPFLFSLLLLTSFQTAYAHDKIALLFLTHTDLNHSELWKKLLQEAPDRYNVYFHSKDPIKDPYFQSSRIPKTISTTWSIHAKAWQLLIQEAVKNPENVRFAFLSESCIPLYSLKYIYKKIMSDEFTHMFFRKPWWPSNDPRELHLINSKYRYGNWEWIVMNRDHAEVVANDKKVIKIISSHPHDQESYFSTLFAIHGCLFEQTYNKTYTYMNWEHSPNGGASPYLFTEESAFSKALIEEAYSDGALFARKFAPEYPSDSLLKMIRKKTKKANKL
jgi:hypothetical protein